jgi:hypothetical protein
MTTPVATLLNHVPALNDPAEPYTFEVKSKTIVGSWDIVHAQYLEFGEAGSVDKKYRITVELDEKKGTYDFTERTKDSGATATTGSDGSVGLSFGTKSFSGKSSSKSFSFQSGGAYKTKDGVSPVLAYSFSTSRIKEPLFTFLEANGYSRKKGFLSGLFNR